MQKIELTLSYPLAHSGSGNRSKKYSCDGTVKGNGDRSARIYQPRISNCFFISDGGNNGNVMTLGNEIFGKFPDVDLYATWNIPPVRADHSNS